MFTRTAVVAALCLLAANASSAGDRVFGISVDQAELAFMQGRHAEGAAYELGRDRPVDQGRAAEAYRRAAVLGFPLAQHDLARLYETGLGVPQSHVLAHVWYSLAASHGHELATRQRDTIAEGMTRKQLARAERIARMLSTQLPR